MFEQPPLQQYVDTFNDYILFLAVTMIIAMIIAIFYVRYSNKGNPILISLPLWLIVILGVLLRLPLFQQGYWYDEAFTSAMVQLPLPEMLVAIAGDVHPPGYYLLTKTFTLIAGHHDITMRIPSLLSGIGMIVAMYHIGKLHGGQRVAMWSALIVAVLPNAIYYSVEARYPMFMALMLALGYIGVRQSRYTMTALALSAAAMSHVNGWFYVAVLGLWLFGKDRNVGSFIAGVVPAMAIASWLPVAILQAGDVSDGFWLQQYPVWAFIPEMTIGLRFDTAVNAFGLMAILMSVLFIAVWRWRKHADSLWLVMVAGVPLIQWLVSASWQPILLPRTLLFSAILLIIPVAWLLQHQFSRIFLVSVVVALVVSVVHLYQTDRDAQVNDVFALCNHADVIYTTNTHTAILARHWSSAAVVAYTDGNSTAQQLPLSSRTLLFDAVATFEQLDNVPDCLISQISVYNSYNEMHHLNRIALLYPHDLVMVGDDDVYYIVMSFESTIE